MSNYTVTTNFLSKDSLPSGNTLKLVKGADLTVEFNNIATAVNTKVDGYGIILTAGAPAGTLTIGATGTVSIIAPSSGATLALTTASGGTTETHSDGTNTTGFVGFDGTNHNLQVGSTSGSYGVELVAGNRISLVVAPTGAVTINAPASGYALTVNSETNAYAVRLFGGATAGQSYGIQIQGGTNSSDWAVYVGNGAQTLEFLRIYGDGGVVLGNTTGGDQGFGSLNAASLFVAGAPLYVGAPQNLPNANYTTVLADANKNIHKSTSTAFTYTIAANASVAYGLGTMLTFTNVGTGALTIAINTDTLTWSPTGATGPRTLAQYGAATAIKISSTNWLLTGSGIT